jgi:hypothetical protein
MGARNRLPARQATRADGIDSLESIPGLLDSFKIRVLYTTPMNETPSRRTTIMSSSNEISTDQLENRVVDGGEGVTLPPRV